MKAIKLIFAAFRTSSTPIKIATAFFRVIIANIPNEKRSLWCIDPSRLKYLIRDENRWKVDLMGQTFRKTLIPPIRKRVMEMTQEHSNDYHDFMRLADSVMKIDKGRYQNKVMKEISNMFLLEFRH